MGHNPVVQLPNQKSHRLSPKPRQNRRGKSRKSRRQQILLPQKPSRTVRHGINELRHGRDGEKRLHRHRTTLPHAKRSLRRRYSTKRLRRRSLQNRKRRPLPNRNQRTPNGSNAPKRSPKRRRPTVKTRRNKHMLQERSRSTRQGHTRHIPHTPIQQDRTIHILHARTIMATARGTHTERRGTRPKTRLTIPRCKRVHRRHR